jgi:hypothetical protein
MLSRSGPLGYFGLLFTPEGMIIGQAVLIIPIITGLVIAALGGIDRNISDTLISLGATGFQTILQVVREARLAILSAVVLGFGRAISEVGVAMMIGGNIRGETRVLTTAIALQTGIGDFPFSIALGIILLLIALVIVVIMNVTYYSAMAGTMNGIDDLGEKRFLVSQFIMMAMQGIPAVYIQSLVGSENDYDGVKNSGMARSINRKKWNEGDILNILSGNTAQARIFGEFTRVITIRQNTVAFHPDCPQKVLHLGDSFFGFYRLNPANGEKIYCISNITASSQNLNIETSAIPHKGYDLMEEQTYGEWNEIYFEAYQTRWLV